MAITRDEVARLALLSRLALTEEELDHLAPQLDEIISAVARVQEVTTSDVPTTSHALPQINVFRDDAVEAPLEAKLALGQAPDLEQDRFRVPRILTEG